MQIKEKIQEDNSPLMELPVCQQNFTLKKKNPNQKTNNHQTTFQHVQPNIHNSQSVFVSSVWKKGFKKLNKTDPGT